MRRLQPGSAADKTFLPACVFFAIAVALFALLTACGDGSSDEPVIDPGDAGNYAPAWQTMSFRENVDNAFFPLIPGTRWVYETSDGSERIEVEVLPDTKEVQGVTATVVRDTVTEDGEVTEDTVDWYAQDTEGNVWYLGEDTKEYDEGKVVSTEGSWEAGVDGALPGIIMHALPKVGIGYRQEYYPGHAEDLAEVLRLDGEASVPFGSFQNVVVIQEWNPLEPGVVENKYYVEGTGVVLEEMVKGGSERVELVSVEQP
jgi:hypothetical protein